MIKRKQTENIDCLFSEFISEKESNGLSKKTIEGYVDAFNRYKKEIGICLSKENIQIWIKQLLDKKIKPVSVNHYVTHIKVFANWLFVNKYLESFEIKPLKKQEATLKTFTDEEIKHLLSKPKSNSKFTDFRDWVIINFIMGTGARASTVVNVCISDINFNTKEITYRHLKNKKIAIIPLSNSLEKVLKQYINMWDIKCEWLFPDQHGKQLTSSRLTHLIRNYCIKRGIRPRGPHSLRHTFAKQFVINGGNAFVLQRILCHSDLTMTKNYVNLYSNNLNNQFQCYCPLDKYITIGAIQKKV